MTIEQHYSPAEVAELVSVSESTVLRACRSGKLASVVLPDGRSRRIPESAVEAWLEEGQQASRGSRNVTGQVIPLMDGRR